VCTLAFAWQSFDDAWLVVGANRDEAVGRPSSPPAVRGTEPRVLQPRDERAGGTWLGVNEHGVFVGVTNRYTDTELAGERSRGRLVADALDASSADDAIETVEGEVAAREYEGFNVVVADRRECALLEWDGVLRTRSFDPGTHVVVNRGFDDRTEKSRAVRAALSGHATPDEWRAAARDALRDHDEDVCVHRDGFGTQSSSLVTVREDGGVHYEFADGPPCEVDYERVGPDRRLSDRDGQL
jgi:uncharacterized protein with NRDE domain